jgi:hypothetical protein
MTNVLVNCDLINGGTDRFTLISPSKYAPGYGMVALVEPSECDHIEWTGGSLRGYMRYATISGNDRLYSLPRMPFYRKRIEFHPENGTYSVSN